MVASGGGNIVIKQIILLFHVETFLNLEIFLNFLDMLFNPRDPIKEGGGGV